MCEKRNPKTCAAILLLLLTAISPAVAKIIYVDDDGPADFDNIQAAIDDAQDGDTIIVNLGTYTGEGNRDIEFKRKAITVRSADPNDANIVAGTIIDCQGSSLEPHRGFYFSGGGRDSVINGLTITNAFGLYEWHDPYEPGEY